MSTAILSPGLAAAIASATTQLEAAELFKAALGSSRRVLGLRNGVAFRDCALTGSVVSSGGDIVSFGITSGTTVATGADLATGTCLLRVTGNGHSVEASLGLPGSGAFFIMQANPTPTNGLAVAGLAISLRPDLPMGSVVVDPDPVDPPAPLDPADAPYSITKVDWSSGSAGAEQTIYFDEDGGDIVHEDAQRAAETGAIPYRRSTQTFIHGTGGDALEIGFHLAILPSQCNDEVNAPVYEVFAPMRPAPNRWSAYPAMATFDNATDGTFLAPCKFIIKRQNGTVCGTIEMHDQLPLSSPLLGQTRNATTALRPLVHTKMMLYWVSHRLKLSANFRKWMNGMVPGTSNRPKQVRQMFSSNPSVPMCGTAHQQVSGYLQWFYMPAWPANTLVTKNVDGDIIDPYAPANLQYGPTGNTSDGGNNGWAVCGYMYEPASISGHNWRTPPGGQDFTRFFMPSAFVAYLTEPNGVRPQGAVPYKLLAHEFGKAFFNRSHHEVTNVRTLETIPHDQVAYGKWAYTYGYYTPQGPTLVTGGTSRHIDARSLTTSPNPRDKDNRLPYHGAELDGLHAYTHPAYYALMFNSVAAMVSAKLYYNATMMSFGGSGNPLDGFVPTPITGDGGMLMQRMHVWRWMNQSLMWKIATTHPIGLSRTTHIMPRFVTELEHFHDTVVTPATDTTHANYNSLYFTCFRNVGIPGKRVVSGSNHYVAPIDDGKLLYFGGMLAVMESTGAAAAFRAVSVKCQKSLDLVKKAVKTYSVDRLIAQRGRQQGTEGGVLSAQVPTTDALVAPANWAAWANALAPVNGQEDMITNADGSFVQGERQQYQHMQLQTVFTFRDFHGDSSPEVLQAITIGQDFIDRQTARVAANQADEFNFCHPPAGILAAPIA